MYREDTKKKATPKSERSVNYFCTLVDIEIIDFIEIHLYDSYERILDMNKIGKIYKGILLKMVLQEKKLMYLTRNT